MVDPDQLYKVPDVTAMLSCSPANVYNLLKSGDLATTKIGAGKAGFRVRGSDILAFLDSRREGGPQPQGTFKHLKFRAS